MRSLLMGAWAVAAAGLVMIAVAVAQPLRSAPESQPVTRSVPVPIVTERSYPADSYATVAVSRDVFRIERRPARVAYDPGRASVPPTPLPPKPTLILAGILWGQNPSAVIEGLPGIETSRVMREGDVVSGLAVREIHRHRVIVVGMDTTWVLTVKEPWKP